MKNENEMKKKDSGHTCVVGQGGHGALWWKHAFHSAGLLRVIEAEETGFTQTERITWREKEEVELELIIHDPPAPFRGGHRNYVPLLDGSSREFV